MALTDIAIRNLRSADSIRKLSDGEGLQLWVTPAGGKIWKLAYRIEGLQKTLTIGPYPEISLADARAKRDEARKLLVSGGDPAQQKRQSKLTQTNNAAQTFSAIAAEVVDKKRREERSESTLTKLEWLHAFANGGFGNRPISEITAAEVLAVLRREQDKGHRETAKRLRAVIGEVFRYAIATGRASSDPTYALRGALLTPKVRHRAAILDPVAFGGLLRAIDDFKGQEVTVAALKLMALLFPRPGELRLAEWREIDLKGAVWTIPAARMKMRREHRLPLSRQSLSILRDLQAHTGGGKYVLPGYGMSGGYGRRVEPRPLSENTLNSALRRMGFAQDEMSAHGFRAVASTMLNESGLFSADAIERALAHQDPDAVRRAYARGDFWEERVRLMQWWADRVDALRSGGKK